MHMRRPVREGRVFLTDGNQYFNRPGPRLVESLEIPAETRTGLIMGLRHRELDVEGVQFHPESILSVGGMDLLRNFLARSIAVP